MSGDADGQGTGCPHCGTPYRYGETGVSEVDTEGADAAAEDLGGQGVAYCPNPGCPGKERS